MIKTAITGNIASGKSAAEAFLINKGYSVIDTDKITHDLLDNNIEVKKEILSAFQNYDILNPEGGISRDKLGKIVFSSNENKTKLENILHKRIFKETELFFENHKDEKAVFVLIPLLFETASEKFFDKIIFISCDENIRLKRLIKRNGYDKEYALKRIKSQQSEEEKIKKSDFVVKNEENLDILYSQLEKILTLLNDA